MNNIKTVQGKKMFQTKSRFDQKKRTFGFASIFIKPPLILGWKGNIVDEVKTSFISMYHYCTIYSSILEKNAEISHFQLTIFRLFYFYLFESALEF